jgi:hypothetical protein
VPADLIVCSTLREVPDLRFPHHMKEAVHRDQLAFAKHIHSVLGYVYSRGGENWDGIKYHLHRHLRHARHLLSLIIEPVDLAAFAGWAQAANAISISRDGGCVRDPAGRLLLGHRGEQDPAAEMPYPVEAQARKALMEAQLRAREIPLFEGLPPIVGLRLRSQWSIQRRMKSLPDTLPPFEVAAASQERLRALKWLAREGGDEPWDEVLA